MKETQHFNHSLKNKQCIKCMVHEICISEIQIIGSYITVNVTKKFVQLHYFLSQNIGVTNDIVFPIVQQLGRHVPLSP